MIKITYIRTVGTLIYIIEGLQLLLLTVILKVSNVCNVTQAKFNVCTSYTCMYSKLVTCFFLFFIAPCLNNTVSCEDGVCDCKPGFGGADCCQCRKNSVAITCDDDGCDECQKGYATPDCCECDKDFYRASNGTCQCKS